MKFVSFHTHTTYSYADGFGTVHDHVKRVHGLGMRALAVSEHGNVNSHAALERECHAFGIKPIFGIEAYFGPVGEKRTQAKTHLTLFAQDEEGYHNLNKLVTQSYIDSYHWPTVSPQNLRKHAKGLVALSGCSDSFLSCTLLGGKFLGERRDPSSLTERHLAQAHRKLEWFCEIFGPDRFFLEVQRFPRLDRTCALNPAYAELSKATGIPLIATADIHYPYAHQNEMQKVLHASRRSGSVAINEQEWEYGILLTYPESDEEIINDLRATGLSESDAVRAVDTTSTLADACTVELPKAKPLRFKLPTSKTILCGGKPTEKDKEEVRKLETVLYFKAKIKEGWKKRKAERPDLAGRVREYSARVDSELKVIADKDFCDYFLVLADLVTWAKEERDITVGPGRGSAAGSVICYLLGITEIDPLHPTFQRMIFERFIDPNRTDMPDIDLDFDDERRHEVVERAREIYGNSNVCNVANHIGYRAKKSLQGVAVAYGLPQKTFDAIAKRCVDRTETDERVDDSILDAIESYASDPVVAELLDRHGDKIRQACELEGNEHSMGIHAGGFIIASEPIPEVCAIYTKEKGQGRNREMAQVIPYEKRDAEHLGLLKMDFLGLITMGVVGKIRNWISMPLSDLYALYYKDFAEGGPIHNQIMSKFLEDDLVGIFQYEGGTTRQVVREVRPTTFDELAACVALSRPGPMYGKGSDGYTQTQNYIAVKNGERDWRRIHPAGFDQHVEWTYGQIVYQEQIMWILRDLAGFSTDRVLRVRKIIGKKLGEHQFAELWEEFKTGCEANGVSEEDAASVWGGITTAAGYAFNTAHSYSYALVAWWSMYFKLYAQTQFFAGVLAKNGDGKDDIPRRTALLQDTVAHNVKVGIIDVMNSNQNWEPRHFPEMVLPGFSQLPGVGLATADDIVAWRGKLPFADYDNLSWQGMARPEKKGGCKGIGPVTVEKFKAFVANPDPFGIHKTEKQLEAFRKQCANGDFEQFGLPSAEEFYLSNNLPEDNSYVAFVGLVANIVYRDEIESIRTRTGKSVDEIRASMDRPEASKKCAIFVYDENGECVLRVSRWRYDALSERIANITHDHHVVVAYGRSFEGKANSVQVNTLWILDPD